MALAGWLILVLSVIAAVFADPLDTGTHLIKPVLAQIAHATVSNLQQACIALEVRDLGVPG